jgi:hypothetical protein
MRRYSHCTHVSILIALLLTACEGGEDNEDDGFADGGAESAADAGPSNDAMPGEATDAGSSDSQLISSLTSDCSTLQGRAIVNFNGNLGISFTEAESPFTFLGSIQFEIPSDWNGAIPNPENWDGSSARQIVAVTSSAFTLHGNHCWFEDSPQAPGSVVISDYRPSEGIVKAQFDSLALRSCTGAAVCTVSGSIETTAAGVFE